MVMTHWPAAPARSRRLRYPKSDAGGRRPSCNSSWVLNEIQPTLTKELIMQNQQYESCIEACNDCADACDTCAAACLKEDDVKMMARCIALDIDCAQLCRLAAAVMVRGGEAASSICQACADVCDMCADECIKHDAQHCKDCADACRRCAAECRNMGGMGGGRPTGMGAGAH
jgi:hypothetical protein